jgi:hypothetical protein
MRNPLATVRQSSLVARATVLTIAMALLFAAVAPVAHHLAGRLGLVAAAVAGLMCLLPAVSALFISGALRGTEHALTGLLSAMLVRTGVPLVLALLILRRGPLVDAGAVHYLVVFYLMALGLETWLSLPVLESNDPVPGPRRDSVL